MKFSYDWLSRWVQLDIDPEALAERLTATGLEVEAVHPVAADFEGVVVARIVACEAHPDADKLSVCRVDDGGGETLQIVCGAPNARAGLVAPLARIGARLGPDLGIRKAKLRGVESRGMLCSAKELGLSDDHSGLLELPGDAPVGRDLRDWLSLEDRVIEIDLTPNRADCLSVRGLARDIAASCDAEFTPRGIPEVPAQIDTRVPIRLDDPEDCARYAGRVIEGLDATAASPLWLKEALRRSGLRSIGPVVDVTNYVMLELGQPMHAFDLDRLQGGITVRRGRVGEKLRLLDGSEVELEPGVLAICDDGGPVAVAGIMGGEPSEVTASTSRVLLESAWFRPATIMGRARSYGLHTDASHRFERGVDPAGQVEAIEHATRLLLDICGGRPGPVLVAEEPDNLPRSRPVRLRLRRLQQVVGCEFRASDVTGILERLGMTVEHADDADGKCWTVTAPSARVDIEREEDLIEEVARIHGYDRIPERPPSGPVRAGSVAGHDVPIALLREILCSAGYHEAITYTFVDRRQLEAVRQAERALPLANPLSADMDVMRTSLVPGLLAALDRNLRRQQERVRLFETGTAFLQNGSLAEIPRIAGVACGAARPEQWGEPGRAVDFFDIKGDVERLLSARGGAPGRGAADAGFAPLDEPWAHPGASARVTIGGTAIGWVGAMHPQVLERLDIDHDVYAFELDLAPLCRRDVPIAGSVSRFPSIRRDLAIWVPEAASWADVRECVLDGAGDLLQNLVVFDVYHDEKLKKGYKSLAIGLILQNVSSTLADKDADLVVERVVSGLVRELKAELRG